MSRTPPIAMTRTRTSELWTDAAGVIYVRNLPAMHFTLEDAKRDLAAVLSIAKSIPFPALIDATEAGVAPKEVRKYWNGPEVTNLFSARAIVVRSRIPVIVANAMAAFEPPRSPWRLFTSRDEAVAWLEEVTGVKVAPVQVDDPGFHIEQRLDGILLFRWTCEYVDADIARRVAKTMDEMLAPGARPLYLSDVRKLRGISAEARRILQASQRPGETCAILVATRWHTLVINFWLRVQRSYAGRVFTDEAAAIAWLVSMKPLAAPAPPPAIDPRAEALLDVLAAYAARDFSRQAPVSPAYDTWDAIATSVNILGEEIKSVLDTLDSVNRNLGNLVLERTREARDSQERAEAAARLASLGLFAGGVAHEINNPLTIIQGLARRLQRKASAGQTDAATVAAEAAKILETCDRMARIVKGMRIVGRAESAAPEPMRLDLVAQETIALARERLREKRIDLRLALDEPLPLVARPVELAQVLVNLLNNAIDAAEPSVDRWVSVRGRRGGGLIELEIADSGTGVPERLRDKIMEPFFTTKDVGKGSGLGLSISRSILRQLGGDLVLKDLKPACFVMRLPDNAEGKTS